jgi:hypothetical protein
MKRRMKNSDDAIAENLVTQPAKMCETSLNNLHTADYQLLWREDEISDMLNEFKTKKHSSISSYLSGASFFAMAIHYDKIDNLMQTKTEGKVTYKSKYTGKTIDKLSKEISPILRYIDSCLFIIDKQTNFRYNWIEQRNAMLTYQENFEERTLENFLSE